MFSRFGKKKTRKEITPINPTIEGMINSATRIHQAHQTTMVGHVDPANPEGQTPGNSIIAGSSADPAQVSSTPSTSLTSVIGVDPVNPRGQTPGNSIIAGPSVPSDPANPQGQTTGNSIIAGPSAPSTSSISAQALPQASIIAEPSAPADPAEVSSSPTSSTSAQALPQAGGRSRISSSISIGQDQAFDEVCKFLTEDDVGIVGIYGMGGVGKTTLTKKVWYEFLGPSNFTVLSIVVSKLLNVDRIQQDIMKEMDLPFEKDVHPHRRARDINKVIASSRRKLALLFDDIWEALDLYDIGVLGEMSVDTSIFKIIFTTRLEDVCSQMQPDREIKIQPLGWDDSWALFAKHVGTKTLHSSHNEILELAKSVAKECKGLPLALIVIGRAMACKYSRGAWEDALYNLQKSPAKVQGSEERLFSILKFSYDNMQNGVEKECFLFCCLYPEDWRIGREELVEFWIGDGILDLDGSYHDTRNRGYAIIDRLSAACLLELKNEYYLTVHDIIRDMGLWIASELKFFVHGERLKLTKDEIRNRWEEANGMYVLEEDDLPEQPHCRNLSTLIFHTSGDLYSKWTSEFQISFLQFMDKLRILKMECFIFLDTTLEIVGQFSELRWLSILFTNIEKFPSEFGNLRKLNVLEIEFESNLDSLPPALGQLRELRKLWIRGPTSIKMLPVELGKLNKLEELVVVSHINLIPIGIFEHMHELRRLELSVGILPVDLWNLSKLEHLSINMDKYPPWLNLDSVGLTLTTGGLKQLSKSLRILKLCRWPIFKWADIGSALETMNKMSKLLIEGFSVDEIIITSKRPEELIIEGCCRLVKLQVGGDALKCLCSLTISVCASLKHIIGLERLEHLKYLKIFSCPMLEGELMNPNEGIRLFLHLESLHLCHLPQVTTICSDHISFPSLLHLRIFLCHKLEKFPRGLMNEKRPLQGSIDETKEWWEGLQWQDEDFKSYLLPLFKELSE